MPAMALPPTTVTASICSDSRPLVVVDDGLGSFGPLTDLRAVFELRAGVGTLLERIERAVGRRADALLVPDRLAAVVAESTAVVQGLESQAAERQKEVDAANGELAKLQGLPPAP